MNRWTRMQADSLNHVIFAERLRDEHSAWYWLISNAAWKDTTHRVKGTVVKVPRGSIFVTVKTLMGEWKWGSGKVQRFLRLLASEGMISTQSGTGKLFITICNYNKFQDKARESGTAIDTPIDTEAARKRLTKDTNYTNSINSKRDNKSSPKRGKRLPDDWEAGEDLLSFAIGEGLTEEGAGREIDKFKDFWHSKAGASATKINWDMTFKNWIRTAVERIPKGQQQISMGSKFRQMARKEREMGN